MNKHYGGIDIGKRTSFACRLDLETKAIEFPKNSLANDALADWFAAKLPASICIDGPPQPNQGSLAKRLGETRFNTERRVAEFALKIYGCYGTPNEKPELSDSNGWMCNSMELFAMLRERWDWTIDLGDGSGQLMETHPTYGFRSLLGMTPGRTEGDVQQLNVDPNRDLVAKRPRKVGGHAQRIELLQQSFTELGFLVSQDVVTKWEASIDYVDATLCALMALWRDENFHNMLPVGDPEEGAIYIARPRFAFKVSPVQTVTRIASPAREKQRPPQTLVHKLVLEPPNAVLMRLGNNGPGGLSQTETTELAISAFQQGDVWLPVGTNHNFKLAENLEAVSGRLFLSFANTLRLAVTTGEIHFQHNGSVPYPGEFNPWPVDACTGWMEMLNVEEVDINEFQTRQEGRWQSGFSARGSNLLTARVNDRSESI